MSRVIIRFPRTLNIVGALRLSSLLDGLSDAAEYLVDFDAMGHTEPFGMLYAAAKLRAFMDEKVFSLFTPINYERHSYQGHMGFFGALGFPIGNVPGQALGGNNYLPITELGVDALRKRARANKQKIGEVVEEHANRMARVLVRADCGDLYETLGYSLREIMRNVVEHSGGEAIYYCAQHWPTRQRVHLAILDTGMGVRESLSANPHLKIDSDLDALKLSIMPGISGKMFEGVRMRKHDVWQNSGYGLYMTSRLSISGGNFWVFSGTAGLGVMSGRTINMPCSFQGTALRLSIDTTRVDSVRRALARFDTEGRAIAQSFAGTEPIGASAASLMIRTKYGY